MMCDHILLCARAFATAPRSKNAPSGPQLRRPGIERRAFSRSESAVWGVVETFFATVITKRVRAPPGEENQQ